MGPKPSIDCWQTLTIITKLSWWSMIIFPLPLSQWWSKNFDGLFRLSWKVLITSGLIAIDNDVNFCPNMQIYPRFKINTRMQDLKYKRKKRNICLQSKTDKNIQLTYIKSLNLWNDGSKARSKINSWVQRQSIMQAVAAKIKTENPWLPPLGQGMSVLNFGQRTVRKYSLI